MSEYTLGWSMREPKVADPIENPTGGPFIARKTCVICDDPIPQFRGAHSLPYCSDDCYHQRIKSVAARHTCPKHPREEQPAP